MGSQQTPNTTERARKLRATQTSAESLLWQRLRGRKLGGLKFRRQHPLNPFIVDFACIEKRFIVELDGEYHEHIYERDQRRQQQLEADGWQVVRFSNADVLGDVESVAISIARLLQIESDSSGS